MINPPSTPDRQISGPALCEACGHPLDVHDATSLRWCAATKLGVGTRKCMCSGVESEARVLTFY